MAEKGRGGREEDDALLVYCSSCWSSPAGGIGDTNGYVCGGGGGGGASAFDDDDDEKKFICSEKFSEWQIDGKEYEGVYGLH